MPYVAMCAEANASQTCTDNGDGSESCVISCSAMEWGAVPGLLPPLSISDAAQIALAIGLIWAAAFGVKSIRRFIKG